MFKTILIKHFKYNNSYYGSIGSYYSKKYLLTHSYSLIGVISLSEYLSIKGEEKNKVTYVGHSHSIIKPFHIFTLYYK